MPRIGIYTGDFLFYHEIIDTLRKWGLPFTSLEHPTEIPPDVVAVLSTPMDFIPNEKAVKGIDPLATLRKSIPRLLNKQEFDRMIIGVDPGPYPGIAVFGDGILIEAYECPTLQRLSTDIKAIASSYSYRSIQLRLGDGDAPNRDLILQSIRPLGISISIVSEKNTSFPHKIHDNALSAARIANVNSPQISMKYERYHRDRRKTAIENEFVTIKSVVH